jgi:predicted nucleic acid-binding protein
MRVAFDAVTLSAYLHPKAVYPVVVDRIPERLELLVEELEAANAKIIVPTPVLCEFLVLAREDGPVYLTELTTSDVFEVQPFDVMAAVEAAAVQAKAMDAGDKRSGTSERWQVCKVDRQFVAVAKVHGVSCIYSDDNDIRTLAAESGIAVKGIADLPAPPPQQQQPALFEKPTLDSSSSTASEPPSEQSPGGASEKAAVPVQDHPSTPLAVPKQPPQDSSPSVPPRPPSKQ